MTKINDAEDLARLDFATLANGLYYLTEFVNYQSAAGQFRKIRFFVVDGKIYPLHHIVGSSWSIHMATRREKMLGNLAQIGEEEGFLAEFQSIIRPGLSTAIEALSVRIGLDYFGIDGAINEDGQLVLFEANAAMENSI